MDGFNLKSKSFKTSRRFLCCFGFPVDQKPDRIPPRPDSNKRKRFQFNSPSAKTVPVVDTAEREPPHSSALLRPTKKSKFRWTKSNSNVSLESIQESPRHQNPTTPKPDSDHTPASEDVKRSDPDDASCTSKRLSFRWRIDSIRTGNSHNNNSLPGSPKVASSPKPKPNRTVSMPPSVSFLPEPEPKPVENKLAVARVTRRKRKSGIANARKIDPIIGMSIIAVTLVIMVLWGRLCAILCTSAWFYFVPRLRDVVAWQAAEKSSGAAAAMVLGLPDFDSEEHKKKVVLEGLLKRNHRSFS